MPDNRLTMAAATDIITSRTKYHNSPRWTGTWNTSELVPIYANSTIRPGDTIKFRISAVIRSLQPVFPVMDDAYISIECFFAKHKHLLSRKNMSPDVNDSNRSFAAWLGAQDSLLNMPLPDNTISLPFQYVTGPTHSVAPFLKGGLGDCLGFNPPAGSGSPSYRVNTFKQMTYYSVWNSYFREPSTQNPVTYSVSGNEVFFTGADANVPVSNSNHISAYPLAPVCREHGYFGSALPWPQRNSTAITLPLGDIAPVSALTNTHALPSGVAELKMGTTGGSAPSQKVALGIDTTASVFGAASSDASVGNYTPLNLYADLSSATAATVNQVRYAFAAQRWFEQLARSGNRYDELVYGMTGVRQRDSYDDRPEYLGGKKIPLTQSQVNTTSGAAVDSSGTVTAGGTGSVGAFCHTADDDYYFTKSFDDFGTLMVVAFVRVKDTFHQGIAKEDRVFDKFNMFWSQFANIGEVPIENEEIYVQSDNATGNPNKQVFGYQEAWSNYRLQFDKVTGYARPDATGNLFYLTYCNDFAQLPTLKSFLTGSQVPNVDRTLAVKSTTAGFQWFGQFLFDMDFIRQVPMYSIPGFIDHH